MTVSRIGIRNFRCIEDETFEFSSGVNVIYGDNAEGKTSVLEAIYLFARGRSYKTRKEADLITFGKENSDLRLEFSAAGEECRMFVRIKKDDAKEIEINGYPVPLLSEFIGRFRAVLFSPENLSLVKGSSVERRLFLNEAISQMDRGYVSDLKAYTKILKQKNAYLKLLSENDTGDRALKETYDGQLAHFGAKLIHKRAEYINELDGAVRSCFTDMTSDREKTKLRYDCGLKELTDDISVTEARLLERIAAEEDKEIEAGAAQIGPHRDDILLLLNGRPARQFTSQGQARSLALSLKLAEGDILKRRTGEYPVYMLDDILGELDKGRQEYILSRLKGRQVLITSCLDTEYGDCDRIIRIKEGRIV